MEEIHLKPLCGRILLKDLPFRPSRLLEVIDSDNAERTESIVAAVGPFRHGRKRIKGGWTITQDTFPHEVSVGDRVIHKSTYQHDDYLELNRVRYRCIDPWDVIAIVDVPQPEGFEDPMTGEMKPDKHPLLIHP